MPRKLGIVPPPVIGKRTVRTTFTFVLELHGGTYVSQSPGRTARDALRRWCARRHEPLVSQFGAVTVFDMLSGFESAELVAVDGVQGVWSAAVTVEGVLALVHVIRTAA